MKFLVVLALAAVALAEPEADPLQYYTNGQYIYKAHTAPVVANKYVVPATYYNNPAMYYNTAAMYYSNPAMYYQYNPIVYTAPVAKADEPAEQKPEAEVAAPEETPVAVADPAPVPAPAADAKYIVPAVYTIPQAVTYTTPVVAPVAYKAVPSYYASSAPGVVHQVAKREAEPSADAAYYYNAYGYAAPAVYGYGYRFPSVYAGYRAPAYGYYGYY